MINQIYIGKMKLYILYTNQNFMNIMTLYMHVCSYSCIGWSENVKMLPIF